MFVKSYSDVVTLQMTINFIFFGYETNQNIFPADIDCLDVYLFSEQNSTAPVYNNPVTKNGKYV